MGIAVFGGLFIVICLWMAMRPNHFKKQLAVFSQWSYFHIFEVTARFLMALCFWYFAEATRQPMFMMVIAWLLVIVTVSLILVGEKKHRNFTVWVVERCHAYFFQLAGASMWPFGLWLILTVL